MADYHWLNDIPDDDWVRSEHGGLGRAFLFREFAQLSQLRDGEDWRIGFDNWGRDQTRHYRQWHHPAIVAEAAVWITADIVPNQ